MFGEALSAPGGLERIRSRMGVCPQFDILWKELTGREHLRIYGAIKVIATAFAEESFSFLCYLTFLSLSVVKILRIDGAIKLLLIVSYRFVSSMSRRMVIRYVIVIYCSVFCSISIRSVHFRGTFSLVSFGWCHCILCGLMAPVGGPVFEIFSLHARILSGNHVQRFTGAHALHFACRASRGGWCRRRRQRCWGASS